MPLSNSPNVLRAVGVFSLFPISVGINAFLNPRSALSLLEFPVTAAPQDQKVAHSLVRLYGARTLAMGMTSAIVAYFGHSTALGYMFLANASIAVLDGVVVKDQIGRAYWNHWGFAPVSIAIGSVLLGALD